MEYFNKFVSNTTAGSGNQTFFLSDNQAHTGLVIYKISVGGSYNYSLLFSNIIDSTYSDGTVSQKNNLCGSWEIINCCVARASADFFKAPYNAKESAERLNTAKLDFVPLTFKGSQSKTVSPGEFFSTDPISLSFNKGDYLCMEITFKGNQIPHHPETLLPAFEKTENGYIPSVNMPFAGMVGCDRSVKYSIGCVGDSITQGIGTPPNSYKHWNSLLAERLGEEYSLWNLGIGFARGDDMASNGAWAYKAKHNDIIFVCYGVNDLLNGFSGAQIINNLTKIVKMFKNMDKKVLVQTVPPFDYPPNLIAPWKNINSYILNNLSQIADFVFDNVPVLGESQENPHLAKYGGHPDESGTALWADALYTAIQGSTLLK